MADKTTTEVRCPACNAEPGKPCTQPTENSRRNVTWLHWSRTKD